MFERNKKDQFDVNAGVSSSEDRNDGMATPPEAVAHSANPSGPREATVIGHSIRIDGQLIGDEDVRIEGDVTGTIKLMNNKLTVGSNGKIHAEVYAKSVTVSGVVDGDLYGSERVNIEKSARVHGNITAPRVILEDGARFKGSIEMDPEVAEAAFGAHTTVERAKHTAKKDQSNASKSNGDKPVGVIKTKPGIGDGKRTSASG